MMRSNWPRGIRSRHGEPVEADRVITANVDKVCNMPAPIKLVAERKARASLDAKLLREELFEKCRTAIDQVDDVAGFALVVWGKSGEMRTAYNAAQGPIGPALVPTLVADALNRHVAVMLAVNENTDDSDVS